MNSAYKPALPQQPGQASPAKANVAGVNHSQPGHPQGAQNNHTNNLVGQNLSHQNQAPPPPPPAAAHAAPSMAPVTANMAQMAQNMSHHGNLSLQNSVAPAIPAASPSKSASTSAPLSLVADKPATVPLALTRTPEKKEAEAGQANGNGTVESPKPAANAPNMLKPQNAEPKEKPDIAKTNPSTPKPPEKLNCAPSTPQKSEAANAVGQADTPASSKVVPANEAPEKSPAKPAEPKPAPTADVAPAQGDSKPAPEAANDSQEKAAAAPKPAATANALASPQKPAPSATPPKPVALAATPPKPNASPQKPAPTINETPKPEPPKEKPLETKKEEPKPAPKVEEKKEEVTADTTDGPKKEAVPENKEEKSPPKPGVEKKETPKAKTEPKVAKSTLKLATVTTPVRKRKAPSPSRPAESPSLAKKPAVGDSTPDSKSKRNRTQVQLYQSPTPELTMATKLSAASGRSTPTKPGNDDKLIVFYKNEYLAVRNAEGGFYVCQAVQNVYRSTRKIKIRWLSREASDAQGETYKPDFYDVTDMECVLTTLSLTRAAGGAQLLKAAEKARATSILERAINAERGDEAALELTEEHPDGLDLSLYKDESQLEKKGRKRRAAGAAGKEDSEGEDSANEAPTPSKKSRSAPKRSPRHSKTPPKPKRTPPGSKHVAHSKTATAVTEAKTPKSVRGTPKRNAPAPAKVVKTPAKTLAPAKVPTPVKVLAPAKVPTPTKVLAPAKVPTPTKVPAAKVETPKNQSPKGKGRRAAKDAKPSPIVPTPSTSTGKATRTPRKPPSKK